MKTEAKFKPTGHRRPIHRPRDYEQSSLEDINPELKQVFEKYMANYGDKIYVEYDDAYSVAESCIEGVNFTLEEAQLYMWSIRDKFLDEGEYDVEYCLSTNKQNAGIFLSACYNKVDDKIITHGLDLPFTHIGYKLAEDKVLLNTVAGGNMFGGWAKGLVLNSGSASSLGLASDGVIINYSDVGRRHGSTGGIFVEYQKSERLGEECDGILIALTAPQKYGWIVMVESVIEDDDATEMPWLVEYLDTIRTDIENGVYHSKNEVEFKIRTLLKWGGHESFPRKK
jgi:hypothetical protein